MPANSIKHMFSIHLLLLVPYFIAKSINYILAGVLPMVASLLLDKGFAI